MIRTKAPANAKQAIRRARAKKGTKKPQTEIQIASVDLGIEIEEKNFSFYDLTVEDKIAFMGQCLAQEMKDEEYENRPDIYFNLFSGEVTAVRSDDYGRWFYRNFIVAFNVLDKEQLRKLVKCDGEKAEDIIFYGLFEKGIYHVRKEYIVFT